MLVPRLVMYSNLFLECELLSACIIRKPVLVSVQWFRQATGKSNKYSRKVASTLTI